LSVKEFISSALTGKDAPTLADGLNRVQETTDKIFDAMEQNQHYDMMMEV